ncbi:MAG: RimK/LysX family protein [Myxococcota bacterium]
MRVGWREWVGLPELGVTRIQGKMDTGAKTSALHAVNLREEIRDGERSVRFDVPKTTSSSQGPQALVRVVDERTIRSSNGGTEIRPVIETRVQIGGGCWPIELTLTDRGQMGFRLLLGRQALRSRVLVDPGQAFICDPLD